MLGTASTREVFASATSIGALPYLEMEWNYNMFFQPYVINSYSGLIPTNPNRRLGGLPKFVLPTTTSSWTALDNTQGAVLSSSTVVRNTTAYPSASSLILTAINPNNTNDAKRAKFQSASMSLPFQYQADSTTRTTPGSQLGYRKIVFFAKVANLNYSTYSSSLVTNITASPVTNVYSSNSGSSTFVYSIIYQGTNISRSGEPWTLGTSTNSVVLNDGTTRGDYSTASFSWPLSSTASVATSYKIYRRRASYRPALTTTYLQTPSEPWQYITSIGHSEYIDYIKQTRGFTPTSASFVDNLFYTWGSVPQANVKSLPPAYNGTITLTPTVELLNSINDRNYDPIDFPYLVKSYNSETGQEEFDSTTVKLDSEKWTKVELWFRTPLASEGYNGYNIPTHFRLNMTIDGEYDYAQVAISQIEMYAISEKDFYEHNVSPTSAPFKAFRPGEAQTHPNYPSADRRNIYGVRKPLSFTTEINPIFEVNPATGIVGGAPSIFDQYTQYTTDRTATATSSTNFVLQAFYDTYLSINKIIIKPDFYGNTFSSASVNIYQRSNTSSSAVTTVTFTYNSPSSSVIELFYSGTSWSLTRGTAPQISSSGTLTNVMTQVDGIELVVNSRSMLLSSISNNGIGVVEFSPRLAIDVSNLIQSINVKKDLTSQQNNGFPFSYINANNAQVTLSNIPVYSQNNNPATIFENDAKNSPFYNLLRQGVKLTGLLTANSQTGIDFNETIPLFTMYANEFSLDDIDTLSITAYDSTKSIMQSGYSPQFISLNNNVYTTVSNYLNKCGFSDYDDIALKSISDRSSQRINFWSNNTKSIFENLQDIFIAFQIAAWIDEYGILRFKSLRQVFDSYNQNNFVADFAITDIDTTASTNTIYSPNIIPDSFSQNISERVGSVKINYKTTLRNYSAAVIGGPNSASALPGQEIQVAFPSEASIWNEEDAEALPQFISPQAVPTGLTPENPFYKNGYYFYINPATTSTATGGTPRNALAHQTAQMSMNREIFSYDGLEYLFYNPKSTGNVISRVIYDSSDIEEAINDYVGTSYADVFLSTSSVNYKFTGRMLNLQRGLYGTIPLKSPFQDDRYVTSQFFNYYNIPFGSPSLTFTRTNRIDGSLTKVSPPANYNQLTTSPQSRKIMSPMSRDKGYTVYEMSFKSTTSTAASFLGRGIGFVINPYEVIGGYTGTSTDFDISNGRSVFVEIASTAETTPNQQISIYTIGADGTTTTLGGTVNCPRNLFDGKVHQFRIFIYQSPPSAVNQFAPPKIIYCLIDGEPLYSYASQIGLSVSFSGLSTVTTALWNPGNNNYGRPWGVYVIDRNATTSTLAGTPVTFEVTKIYASRQVDTNYTSNQTLNTKFLRDLARFGNSRWSYTFFWEKDTNVRGFKMYDVKLRNVSLGTPSILPPEIPKLDNGFFEQSSASSFYPTGDVTALLPVTNGIRARFAITPIVNQGLLWINKSTESKGDPIRITGLYVEQSNPKTITKVINSNNTRVIELSTDWFRDDAQARDIINSIARAGAGFHVDINVSVFGNPLIQVGDFAKITYKLKRVGYDVEDATVQPLVCLVTSVGYTIDSEGFSVTQLVLKPMITSRMV